MSPFVINEPIRDLLVVQAKRSFQIMVGTTALFLPYCTVSCFACARGSQLPLRRTRWGPAPTVRLREVSALEGDEVND